MTARYHYQSPDIPSMGADRWWLKAKQGKAGWSRWSPGLSLLSLAPLAPLEIGQLLTRPAHTRVGIVGRVRTIRQNPPDLRFSYFSSLLKLKPCPPLFMLFNQQWICPAISYMETFAFSDAWCHASDHLANIGAISLGILCYVQWKARLWQQQCQ